MTLAPSCRHDWTWGEWFAYIERLQLEIRHSENPPLAVYKYLAACAEFQDLYPPSECVVFPGEGT